MLKIVNMDKNYDDIINLKRPKSKNHIPMSIHDRAAQFSPFAALTGYDEAIKETARLTDKEISLTEEDKAMLNGKFEILEDNIGRDTEFDFIYFLPDSKKEGGAYISHIGKVRKIDIINGVISLTDRTEIEIDKIIDIKSEVFKSYGD